MRSETLLGCGVVVVAAGIVGGVGWLNARRSSVAGDAENMRRLYVALTTYSQSYDNVPAPSLPALRPYVGSPSDFLSEHDPFASAAPPC